MNPIVYTISKFMTNTIAKKRIYDGSWQLKLVLGNFHQQMNGYLYL